jgi:hypothetical protein
VGPAGVGWYEVRDIGMTSAGKLVLYVLENLDD